MSPWVATLDADIANILKSEGDSTPLGDHPLRALPCRLPHLGLCLQDWVHSWVPESVFCASKSVPFVDTWYSTATGIEEVLSNSRLDDFHIFEADVVGSFDTADRDILVCAVGRLGLFDWF